MSARWPVCLLLSCAFATSAQTPAPQLQIEDLTPKFLAFYAAASQPGVDEAQRWALWEQMYHFAAVPPGPEGEKMARRMLDDAWPKFPAAMPMIRRGIGAVQPSPRAALEQDMTVLRPDVSVRVHVVAAVGDFEANAYTFAGTDGPTVAIEVENPDAGLQLTHEFTHVIEAEQAGVTLDWKRTLAHTIFAEGLAVHVVHQLHPELSDAQAVGEVTPNWFARATAARAQILADLMPHLASDDGDITMRYTMGDGTVSMEREAYYAGWLVIGVLLKEGWTFPRLVRVKEDEMVPLVTKTIKKLQH